jgi:anti-sigma B factor antagonist
MRLGRGAGTVDSGGGAPAIPLTGDMDLATAQAMLAPAHQLVAEGHRHIVLNCAALDFCDSQGLMAMLRLLEAVQPDGSVTLTQPSKMLIKMLTITGVVDQFRTRASR